MHLNWQPSATIEHLRARARILQIIRDFFRARDVLEVETPLMCHTSVTDPVIQSIPALFQTYAGSAEQRYYLQTSPEFAMKRLLAAGSGSIYQICKAFRQGEVGRLHNPEFTMLEWYRVGFDHHQLMNEVDALLQTVLGSRRIHETTSQRITYQALFQTHLGIDPLDTSIVELADCAKKHNIDVASELTDLDSWLNLLMTHCIEPALGQHQPVFVYDFPASQAALAKLSPDDPRVAARFEVYVQGMELANGFNELQDAEEQRRRFESNLMVRQAQHLPSLPVDEYFLAALQHGLPDCAGVALGIDRLIMLALDCKHIQDSISFDVTRS